MTTKMLIVEVPEGKYIEFVAVNNHNDTTNRAILWPELAAFRILDPAQAVPDVWQYRHVDFEGDATPWTDCTREDAERIAARHPNESGGYEVRALFAAPPSAAVGVPTNSRHEWQANYEKLLYAVARKFPGESRFDTALRYIQEAECQMALTPAGAVPDVSHLDLLQIAREAGLRQHLHGLNACASRVMLLGFVEAVVSQLAAPSPSAVGDALADEYRKELDKLSQRNYELRMENAKLKSQPAPPHQ